MAAVLDVQQLVERVAVGNPRGPFLVGREQVAVRVESQADGEANAGGDDLCVLKSGETRMIAPDSSVRLY